MVLRNINRSLHVEHVANANDWDVDLTKDMLMTVLSGRALRLRQSVPVVDQANLDDVLDALRNEFGRPTPCMTLIT